MSSYLEAYGAGEEQRQKRIRLNQTIVDHPGVVLVIGGTLYAIFENYAKKAGSRISSNCCGSATTRRRTGCGAARKRTPCRDYTYAKFPRRLGTQSPHADQSVAKSGLSQSCGSGVSIRLDYSGQ